MTFIIAKGVPSIIFAVFFFVLALCSAWLLRTWGRRSGFLRLLIFCAIRLGAAICGVIVAADNFSNVNVIIAEIILSQIGSFVIYYALVGFYHSTAKYYGFWQNDLGNLIQRIQHLTLYILVALAIASGVEGSSYTDPSSIALAQKLAQAYSIIFMVFLLFNIFQWGAMWASGKIGRDEFAICCSFSLFFIFLKAIYLIASSWVLSISLRNPFINAGWDAGAVFAPDFLACLILVVGGFMAPLERREAAAAYASEAELQSNGARYDQYGNAESQKWGQGQVNYQRQ